MKIRGALVTSAAVSVFFLACAGCASTYQPTPAAISYEQHMTRAQAVAAFRQISAGHDGAWGICGGNLWERAGPVSVSSRGFRVQVARHIAGGTTMYSGPGFSGSVTTSDYNGPTYYYSGSFAKISKARLLKTTAFTTFCGGGKLHGSYMLRLSVKGDWWMYIEVAPQDRDRLMGAMMVLAPKARFVSGLGI